MRTSSKLRNRPVLSRAAARKRKLAQDAKSPGHVSDKLRRKMGDTLADIFSEAGTKLYSDAVLELKGDMERIFKDGISGLEGTIKEELGNRGLSHASDLFKPWISELVEEIIQFGLEEISGGLEDLASDVAAEFSKKPEEEEGDEELLGMDEEQPAEEVESVEEEPVAEPADEAPAEGGEAPAEPAAGGEDLLEGLDLPMPGGEAGASFRSDPYAPRTWRQRGTSRKVTGELKLIPENLVNMAGGLDKLQRVAKTANDAFKLLRKVQAKAIPELTARNSSVLVKEVAPLDLLDYVNRFWAYR